MMQPFLIATGMVLFLMVLIVMYRVWRGPTVIDRIVAANIIGTKTMVLLVVIGTVFGRVDMFVDLALTYALLNFIGSLAATKFFRRQADHGDGPKKVILGGANAPVSTEK